MSTLLITTPGMGKTYLVKEMKHRGILALDFDIKGAKPTTVEAWEKARVANTSYINFAFDAGYECVTAWPDSINLESLNKDVEVIFVIPVGDAWTGCLLRIAARQPGTPFIDDMMERYHELVNQLEGMFLDAVNTHQNAKKVIVTNAHDTLLDVCRDLNTIGYDGGRFLDVNARFSPESAVEAILPKRCRIYATEIFKNCLTPDLVSQLTYAIDHGDLSSLETTACGFGMFSYTRLGDILDIIPDSSQVSRIENTCGNYYLISHQTLTESDEMGDWYRCGYVFLRHYS